MCFILKKDKQKALKLLKQKINGEIKITYREIANISNYSLPQIKRFSQEVEKKDIDELLIHGLTGKNSNNSASDQEIEYIKEFKNQYPNISISQFRDIYHEDVIWNKEKQDHVKKYNLTIVEYKPTKPKQKEYNEEDLMQVFAQKICVDYVFKTDCECILYYADVKKRITLPVKDDFKVLNHKLKSVLEVIRQNLKCGIIPMKEKNQKCSGCSLINICLPKESSSLSLRQRLLEDDGIE